MKGRIHMKNFETPVVEVTSFAVEDIITESSTFVPPVQGDDQTPYG